MSLRKKTYSFLALVALFAVSGYFVLPYLSSDWAVSSADSKQVQPESTDQKDEQEQDEETTLPVEVAIARKGDISSTIGSTANLKAKREVEIASRAEGVVRQVLVEEGAFVRTGQLLCKLDDTQARIRLQSSRQKLAQAKLQLEKAQILQEKTDVQVRNTRDELIRYEKLFEERLVSEKEVAEVKYRMDELKHDLRVSSSEFRELTYRVDELESDIEQAELEISRTTIEAPFSGFLTERLVEIGQTVRNLDPLFKLGDFSPLEASVFLSEREASLIERGQAATILSGVDDEVSLEGQVARISPVVDGSTGTVKVTVELAGGNSLFKPGAFVRVEIRTDTRQDSVLIPKRAIVEEDGDKFVFVTQEDSVKRVRVELGYQTGADVEVLAGIGAGDSVIVAGQGGLKDGSKVRLVEGSNA